VLKDWTEHTEVRGVADGERRIFEHIARHRVQAHGSETWLAEGLRHHTADECPFCGQRLAGEVQKVIDELRTAFERTQDERVRREFDYFDRNKDAVAYGAYREGRQRGGKLPPPRGSGAPEDSRRLVAFRQCPQHTGTTNAQGQPLVG
jgi:hypothetical protein